MSSRYNEIKKKLLQSVLCGKPSGTFRIRSSSGYGNAHCDPSGQNEECSKKRNIGRDSRN